jgi:hypothetical protein
MKPLLSPALKKTPGKPGRNPDSGNYTFFCTGAGRAGDIFGAPDAGPDDYSSLPATRNALSRIFYKPRKFISQFSVVSEDDSIHAQPE